MSNISKNKDDHWSPDGSIGSKIKRIRELRGLTQKQLGLRCGYSPSTADVGIAQYEKNKKMPREKALNDIANALNVDKSVFLISIYALLIVCTMLSSIWKIIMGFIQCW